tara:strand:- start:1025 stop:1333 length:309 start_codon:yes stop_codon:yes gene_type:complete
MIDTDKYEGHNDAPWRTAEGQPYDDEGSHLDIVDANGVLVTETSYFTDIDFTDANYPNIQLIADAPLLLAEVKRLRKAIIKVAFDEHESVYEMKQALVEVIE